VITFLLSEKSINYKSANILFTVLARGLKDVDYYKEGGIYKYTYGASSDYNKVLRTKRTITAQFKDAFIIAFRNGEKMNVNEAIAEFKKRRNK
jgi:N-acetylmuramoyl-L-alanine amidase